jgi:hypothetical protein
MSGSNKIRRNPRTISSAAGQAGCCGVPDFSRGPYVGDGGLASFSRVFNRRFDEMAQSSRPEWRSFSRAEVSARTCL